MGYEPGAALRPGEPIREALLLLLYRILPRFLSASSKHSGNLLYQSLFPFPKKTLAHEISDMHWQVKSIRLICIYMYIHT